MDWDNLTNEQLRLVACWANCAEKRAMWERAHITPDEPETIGNTNTWDIQIRYLAHAQSELREIIGKRKESGVFK